MKEQIRLKVVTEIEPSAIALYRWKSAEPGTNAQHGYVKAHVHYCETSTLTTKGNLAIL